MSTRFFWYSFKPSAFIYASFTSSSLLACCSFWYRLMGYFLFFSIQIVSCFILYTVSVLGIRMVVCTGLDGVRKCVIIPPNKTPHNVMHKVNNLSLHFSLYS